MEVIVTDHHQPGGELPDCPILHPAIGNYPFAELCGTAVAWKLACALREAAGIGSPEEDLDLVALATVADVVPLVGENRSLVRRGLEEVRRARRPGMRALIAASRCEPTRLDEGDLAFRLAPRINAAGRLYRADAGVELFLTEDEARAEEIAAELNRANGERRAPEREVDGAAEAARRELPEELREAPGLVLAGRDWHPGVIGIVASRLVERHHRPVVVISLDGEGAGAARGAASPASTCWPASRPAPSTWSRFGGHRAAAGLELRAEDLDAFREAFAAHATAVLGPEDLRKTERIDAMVGGASLGLDLAEELGKLAPFGMGNPGCGCWSPPPGSATCGRWGRASTRASASTAAPTGRSGSPSAARGSGSATTTRSTPRCGSRSTTGTARSSRGSSCASSTPTRPPRTAPARPTPRSGGGASRPSWPSTSVRAPARGRPPRRRAAAARDPRRQLARGDGLRAALQRRRRPRPGRGRSPPRRAGARRPGAGRLRGAGAGARPAPRLRARRPRRPAALRPPGAPRLPAHRGGRLPAPGLGRCRAPLRARGPRVAPRPAR